MANSPVARPCIGRHAIRSARREELAEVDGVGGIIADAVLDWFTVEWHREIVEAAAMLGREFDAELLPAAPGLRVLATSRQPLALEGELTK